MTHMDGQCLNSRISNLRSETQKNTVNQRFSIKHGIKLYQMSRGGCWSSDMQCEAGTGNANCISGLFIGALGAVEGNVGGCSCCCCCQEATAQLYALLSLPLKSWTSVSYSVKPGRHPSLFSLLKLINQFLLLSPSHIQCICSSNR